MFSEASQQSYGACAYIRGVTKDVVIHTKLICGISSGSGEDNDHATVGAAGSCSSRHNAC